jgi:exodeoxyribonuclease V gamma subunit
MAAKPRRGDRSRRDDDRYLFLEALISARRCLYLSYVGRSIRDNTEIPPSVLVSELLDYLRRAFTAPDGGDVVDGHVRTVHPLQPFSRRYFQGDDGPLFSYSTTLCDASRALRRGEGRTSSPLCVDALPALDASWRTVTPEQLVRFFLNPARYFLVERLQVRLDEAAALLEPREPFRVDGLDRFGLRNQMLGLRLDGAAEDLYALVRAGGALPHGEIGRAVYRGERAAVDAFASRVRAAVGATPRVAVPVRLATQPVAVEGPLRGIAADGLVDYRLARTRARDRLSLWIRHLLLACAAPVDVALRSVWLGDDKTVELGPVPDPEGTLHDLLRCYWDGLHRPLHFFPESAFVYCAKERDLGEARDCWEGDDYGFVRGESEDPYYAAAFRDTDPLDGEFERLAALVYEPMIAAGGGA